MTQETETLPKGVRKFQVWPKKAFLSKVLANMFEKEYIRLNREICATPPFEAKQFLRALKITQLFKNRDNICQKRVIKSSALIPRKLNTRDKLSEGH